MRAQPRESPRQRQTLPRGLPSPRPVPRDGSSSALLDPGPTRLQAGAPSSPSSPRILREHLGEVGSPLGGLLPASPMRAPPASQGRPWPGSHPQTHLGESGQRWPRPAGEGQGEEAVRGRVRGAAGLRASSREDIGKQQQPGHPPAGGGARRKRPLSCPLTSLAKVLPDAHSSSSRPHTSAHSANTARSTGQAPGTEAGPGGAAENQADGARQSRSLPSSGQRLRTHPAHEKEAHPRADSALRGRGGGGSIPQALERK